MIEKIDVTVCQSPHEQNVNVTSSFLHLPDDFLFSFFFFLFSPVNSVATVHRKDLGLQ